MFFALRIMPSVQFEEFPENQELLEFGFHDDEFEGHHDEPELLIEGNHDEFELLLILGNQEDDDDSGIQSDDEELDDDSIAEPSTTPTPKPIPNTASTVEMG